MKHIRLWTGILMIALTGMAFLPIRPQPAAQGEAIILTATGAVTPALEQYISRGIRTAESRQAEIIILKLDTPGGQIDIMSKIVQQIRASTVPVVVYVAPQGAMAASAGAIITLAGHAAAMAPETIIGAASPVGSQGEDIGETEAAKTREALTANVRTLTSRRPPQAVQAAEEMINNTKAYSAEEAREIGLIDYIASDTDDLLRQLDGTTVFPNDQPVTLHTTGLAQVEVKASFIEQLLATLVNPNIVFLLLSVGVQAILIELSNPGGWVAGFIGVVCVALAVYGLGILPVNWFGILFLVLAFILFILEIKAPTHGALTAAGAACMVIGALVLFNTAQTPTEFHISVPLVVAIAGGTALVFFLIVGFALRSQRTPIRTGSESLMGKEGIVKQSLTPTGEVQVAGETWSAKTLNGETLQSGEHIRVVRVQGLHVIVEKADES